MDSLSDVRKWETITDAAEWESSITTFTSAIDVIDDNVTMIDRIEKQRSTDDPFRCFLQPQQEQNGR